MVDNPASFQGMADGAYHLNRAGLGSTAKSVARADFRVIGYIGQQSLHLGTISIRQIDWIQLHTCNHQGFIGSSKAVVLRVLYQRWTRCCIFTAFTLQIQPLAR